MNLLHAVNPDVLALGQSDRGRIEAAVARTRGVADLASGNPDMAVPEPILTALRRWLERTDRLPYSHYDGRADLRRAIAGHLERRCGITADPDTELLVTHGVQEGLYVVLRTILRPGDEVLLPSPHYGHYALDTTVCGGRPRLVELDETAGWLPDPERLAAAVTPRTRALLFCNPSNPLGVVWPPDTLGRIAAVAIAKNLLVLVDEVYRPFAAGPAPVSIASLPGMRERTFTLNGFSKAFFLMGARMGYVCGPAALMTHVRRLQQCVTMFPSSPGEVAALAALQCPEEGMRPVYERIGALTAEAHARLSAIDGITCVAPAGGFYLFPNVAAFGIRALDLAVRLIEEAGVSSLPGTEFGPFGEGHLRLSVCAGPETVAAGLERLERFFARLPRSASPGRWGQHW